jgi:hypothetical protein
MATTNTEAYVSTGKPKVGGAVFVGATTLTPPTDAVTALNEGFAGMGYVSEDGVTQSQEVNSEEVKAWGGDTVLVTEDDKSETWQLTFIEMMNINVLKEIFGENNVTGTLETGIAIASGTEAHEARCWVIDMILKGGALKRTVIPKGVITEIGDVVYNDTDPVGYPVTIKATSDENGKYHYEYLKAASSGT